MAGGHLQTSCRMRAGKEPIPKRNCPRHPLRGFSLVIESSKVFRGLCRAIRGFWRQQKDGNNFLFFIKTCQTAAFNSFWPDGAGSCAILQEDSHREESWQ